MTQLLALIRALPPWVEFAIVIAIAFGWFIFASLTSALRTSYVTDYVAAKRALRKWSVALEPSCCDQTQIDGRGIDDDHSSSPLARSHSSFVTGRVS